MRLPRHNTSISLLCLLAVALLLSSTSAQDLPTLTGTTNNAIPEATGPAATTAAETAKASTTDATSAAATSGDSSDSSALPGISSASATATTAAATSGSPPPRLSTDTEVGGLPSGLPTLPGGFKYPAPSVPPTANAPYMKKSTLPEGTVFIAVGAALGLFAFFILLWRVLVAWSINRSVKRAALKSSYANYGDAKSLLKHKSGLYTDAPPSTISLEKLSGHHRTSTAHSKNAPSSSLFFSPTAGAGMHTQHRNSGYLPAGYYAAGTSVPGGGNQRPTSQGYPASNMRPRSMGQVSPPDSPSLAPSSRGQDPAYARSKHASTSTLNLNQKTDGRAPSTYLDDLFDGRPTTSDTRRSARYSQGQDRR